MCVVAPLSKLAGLEGRPLLIETDDTELARSFNRHVRALVAPRREVLYPLRVEQWRHVDVVNGIVAGGRVSATFTRQCWQPNGLVSLRIELANAVAIARSAGHAAVLASAAHSTTRCQGCSDDLSPARRSDGLPARDSRFLSISTALL